MNKTLTCCFTGYRLQKLPFGANEEDERCVRLKTLLRETIEKAIKEGYTHFLSGMATGVDTFAAEIVLSLKEKYPGITLEAAIPCETQADKWHKKYKDRYRGLLSRCDRQTVLQKEYSADCMMNRNKYMVDRSDAVIAVWDGKPGGTGITVRYAEGRHKRIVMIDPVTFEIKSSRS